MHIRGNAFLHDPIDDAQAGSKNLLYAHLPEQLHSSVNLFHGQLTFQIFRYNVCS